MKKLCGLIDIIHILLVKRELKKRKREREKDRKRKRKIRREREENDLCIGAEVIKRSVCVRTKPKKKNELINIYR